MYSIECCGFESHLRQLIFSRKSDCLGCAVLFCLVCLFDLAYFFLFSFSSLIQKHVRTVYTEPLTRTDDSSMFTRTTVMFAELIATEAIQQPGLVADTSSVVQEDGPRGRGKETPGHWNWTYACREEGERRERGGREQGERRVIGGWEEGERRVRGGWEEGERRERGGWEEGERRVRGGWEEGERRVRGGREEGERRYIDQLQ